MKGNQLKLRVIMLRHDMTAKDVSLILNKKTQSVARYMCGMRAFSDELLATLENHLKKEVKDDRGRPKCRSICG